MRTPIEIDDERMAEVLEATDQKIRKEAVPPGPRHTGSRVIDDFEGSPHLQQSP